MNAFKALGASFAIYKWMSQQKTTLEVSKLTFCTATDGNHGRAVAWAGRKLGVNAVVYVPSNTVPARIDAIKGEGAKVIVVDGNYDQTVTQAAQDAEENGWQVISDTAYPGYMDIPADIMSGYTTIFQEIENDKNFREVDLVFLQAGVGGLAAAATWYYYNKYGQDAPRLVCVEPLDADCLLESIKNGNGDIKEALGNQDSIMAGLNCGTPSLLAWPLIKNGMEDFIAIDDTYAKEAMINLAHPIGNDEKIISGESGAAGFGGLLALIKDDSMAEAREKLNINKTTKILLINTEGDTDPVNYQKVLNEV